MPRVIERTTMLSRDVAEAIRYFCFGNLSEFYKRYQKEIGFSRATFFRIMQGGFAIAENIRVIELLAIRLRVADKDGLGSSYVMKRKMLRDFIRICDLILSETSVTNIDHLREFLKKNRGIIIS